MLSSPARTFSYSHAPARPALSIDWLRACLASPFYTPVVLALAIPFVFLALRQAFGDVWWVLSTGEQLVQQGHLLDHDPFTFAPHTDTYFDAQWLTQLIFVGVYRVSGLGGLIVMNAAVCTASLGLLF